MLRWLEGFEIDRSSTYLSRKYAQINGASNFLTGRLHGYCLSTGASTEFRPASFGVQNTWVLGFGFNHSSASTSSMTDLYISIKRGASEQLRLQFLQDTSTTFKIQIKRGSTVLDTSAAFDVARWHYFEFKVTVDPSSGAYELRHNETLDTSDTGVNTANAGVAGADIFDFQSTYSSLFWDDIYILDSTGANNNDFLGDTVIEGRLPTGDGVTTQWTPSTGLDHYALVDDPADTPADGDYVSSATAAQLDLFTFDNLSFTTGQIFGVMVMLAAELDTPGSRVVKAKARSGGSNYDGGSWTIASTDIATYAHIFETDPDTAALWAVAAVDAAEFGMEVVS